MEEQWIDAASSSAPPPQRATLKASVAQDTYPSRAITVINPFPPGGAIDVVMRPLL
jgi:tripartite-type tricarboxylate transporter receptor subunit TctC